MTISEKFGITAVLLFILVLILAVAGWVLNIAAIVHANFADFTVLLAFRLAGVFIAPLGVILGWVA